MKTSISFRVNGRATALDIELRQSSVSAFADPADALLRQARQRLYNLENELKHELGASAPRQ